MKGQLNPSGIVTVVIVLIMAYAFFPTILTYIGSAKTACGNDMCSLFLDFVPPAMGLAILFIAFKAFYPPPPPQQYTSPY